MCECNFYFKTNNCILPRGCVVPTTTVVGIFLVRCASLQIETFIALYAGNEDENAGDRLFLKIHDNFSWFPHMWSHMQAHLFNNVTELCNYMDLNRKFAVVSFNTGCFSDGCRV